MGVGGDIKLLENSLDLVGMNSDIDSNKVHKYLVIGI